MTTEEKFQAAVNIIRSLPKDGPYQPSHDMMLKFYGLYKQAVEGPCTEPKPAFYEVVKGYKWQAWQSLGDMSKAEAKSCYVEELKKIIETMAYTENVANFIDALGPFYEYVDMPGKKKLNNNNTAKGPPSAGDFQDSCNEGTESNSSGRNSPLPNGLNCNTHIHDVHQGTTAAPVAPETYGTLLWQPCAEPFGNDDAGAVVVEEEVVSQEEDEEEDEEEEVEEQMVAAAVHKVYSDSDTDEEYSEPAESLVYLSLDPSPQSPAPTLHHTTTTPSTFSTTTTTSTPVQQLNTGHTDEEHSTPQATAVQERAVTHGGGDESHPGGLQMTTRQGYGHSPSPSQLPLTFLSPSHHTQGLRGAGGGSGGGGGGRRGGGRGGRAERLEEDVSAQLVVVLRRLQTDMESVLHRLNTLETLTLTQHHIVCRQCQGAAASSNESAGNGTGRSWWPFPELSPRSTFFLLLWPLILLGGFRLLPLLRCRRKRS